MSTVAEIKNLRAYYITEAYGVHRTVKAVDDISLDIRENEIYGIAGESGCGKSTLLKVLLGMITPPLTIVGGSVTYDFGHGPIDVLSLSPAELRAMRWKEVSYIPQGSMHVLNPVRRIRDTFRDFIGVHLKASTREIDDRVRHYLRDLGLPEKVLLSYPHQLSGGMRQRVTIALATILSPKLIVADEPTTALDVVVQRGVIQLLEDIRQRERNTMVVVTHDMGVHANLADRVAVLYAGQLMEEADTLTLFEQPRHPYTQHLIRSLPKIDDRADRVSIPGRPPALDNPPAGCRFHPRCPHVMDICTTETPALTQIGPNHRAACFLLSEQSVGTASSRGQPSAAAHADTPIGAIHANRNQADDRTQS
ncbi:MAG TPA: ABC transporter ATP-binding protein [Roseiflexaceae bacterium]|nr:ABC transporter ATP-binding protein [Roseiflexaceae bacterium]